MAKAKRKTTADAVEILHRRYYAGKPQRLAALEQARANDHVARKLTALRIAHGLSQRQLAQLIGTTASVICRLEDANYEGHSLAMLNRIAAALNQRVEIRFVPAERRLRSAGVQPKDRRLKPISRVNFQTYQLPTRVAL